jgi:hypothetical protein
MSITDIEAEIEKLPTKEITVLRAWLDEYHERRWDEQIANDADSGKLDDILERVRIESEAGLGTPL